MTDMKKVLCFVVVFVMLFCNNVFAAKYTDLEENSDLAVTVDLLSKMGIVNGFDDDTFRGDENITRGEFAVMVARMLKLPEQIDSTKVYYIDVPASHWAAGSIEQLTTRKYLSGKENGYFGINDDVILEEACTVFLRICGYEPLAEAKGGFPYGYAKVASDVKLLKNVSQREGTLSRSNAAMLIKNALNLGMYSADSISKSGVEYSVSKDTILSTYWDIYHTEGTVTAANGTDIYGASDSTESIRIDNVEYETDKNTDYIDYLGLYVDAYYTDIKGIKKLYFIGVSGTNNKVTKIQYDEFESVDDDYNIRYYANDKLRTKKLNNNVKVIYNGVCLPSFTPDVFNIEYGYIELIETTSSGVGVAKIWDFETCYVTSVDSGNHYIYGKNINGDVDLSDDNDVVMIKNKAMENLDFSSISVKSILTVARYDKTVRVFMSEEVFDADVKYINSVKKEIVVNDIAYKIVPCYYDAFSESFGTENMKLYLDVFGNIAYAEGESGSEYSYAYLINGYKEDNLNEKIVLKLFAQDGKIRELPLSEKASIDNIKYKDAADRYNALCSKGSIISQLVRIKTNSDEEITCIDTPKKSEAENDYTLSENIPFGTYRFKWNGSIGGRGVMSNSTLIFVVPTDGTVKDAEDRDFSIAARSNYGDNSGISLVSYKTTPKIGYEQVCVIKQNNSDGVFNDAVACVVISELSKAVNNNEEIVTKIKCYANGTEQEILTTVEADIEPDYFKEGDVVRLALNSFGEATSASREISIDDFESGISPSWAPINSPEFDLSYRKSFVVPYESEGAILRVAYNLGDKWSEAYEMAGTYTLVDTTQSRNKVMPCNINDIHPYDVYGSNCDRIFVQGRASSITSVVVFR